MKKVKEIKRHLIQLISAVLVNSNFKGFRDGTIYKGNSKQVCVPGLNCYSCPGAIGACPIGSLQGALGKSNLKFPFYIVRILLFFGILVGRLICGFLCLFGFIQDILYKIPLPKINIPKKADKVMRYFKYVVLLLFVILLPIFLKDEYGTSAPYFCKWICPAGTLEGGLPLIIKNESLRQVIGFLFDWKVGLLILIILSSIFIYRPFCKYICPLGAIYSLFNKFSFYKMKVDKDKCVGCKLCEKNCNMKVEITKNINSNECIRCGKCKSVCKHDAITSCFEFKK